MKFRQEEDSLGIVNVPADHFWGAQTERSLENFPQEVEKMPHSQIMAIASIKRCAAIVNNREEKLDDKKKDLIVDACDRILKGEFDEEFPLTVWQTGSGTQTNMNVNEVISHIANENEKIIHPNDHVNMSQSSNDVFPTAMHLSTYKNLSDKLLKELPKTIEAIKKLEEDNKDIIKTGRTHLQDATPVKLSQEISAWRTCLERDLKVLEEVKEELTYLAIGGTAVGTGINAKKEFGDEMAKELSDLYGFKFKSDENKFYQLSSKSALVNVHGTIKALATDLYKIANDIRFLSCGPRCGISELTIPANEPGSSIMPGKVNPTQVESITMICIKIMANDFAISMANTQGQLQLNAYMPLIIHSMDNSITLLSKSLKCFREKLLEGLVANEKNIEKNLENSLMLVTSLSPHIGYDKASKIAKYAFNNNLTLKEASHELGYLKDSEFDKLVKPEKMV
ncbi:class II fumarate hydratase [Anaerococcus hydrogenalis]|uniref:Fumarate hydratase class II n=1 Tax=Anaerococcus hydrogenalis TaxID=33029 RepID=A0A2N6UI82_9FIRM|nr:class II fumarate hydratase [Anaerococcus hydrogenalis]MDK7694695.1 class II fumarate hydratase [Anaerococcus hydrogenalis]MDK7696751.1 class II fumarate hydratase [Anaerococcus hydrogenalis]MDK7707722.1 class II fumarate hydratase [Anaerococcus hydrogenalis]PMC81339.1 class II fumarate hydratase [Anaerococcus hydrogenalis]